MYFFFVVLDYCLYDVILKVFGNIVVLYYLINGSVFEC